MPGSDVLDALAIDFSGLCVAVEAVEGAAPVGDLDPAVGSLDVPSFTGPVGFIPAGTTSGCQSARHEPVQMNLPFFSTLRL